MSFIRFSNYTLVNPEEIAALCDVPGVPQGTHIFLKGNANPIFVRETLAEVELILDLEQKGLPSELTDESEQTLSLDEVQELAIGNVESSMGRDELARFYVETLSRDNLMQWATDEKGNFPTVKSLGNFFTREQLFGFLEQHGRLPSDSDLISPEELVPHAGGDFIMSVARIPSGKYGVYHWDTFDNETLLQAVCDTLEKAEEWVTDHYGDRLQSDGADRVDIVHNGEVVRKFMVK